MKNFCNCALLVCCVAGAHANLIEEQVNHSIPDGDASGLASTLNLTGISDSITSLEVTLNISGTYNGDLYAYLVHDGGFSVLLNRVGRTGNNDLGYGDGGLNATFADGAANGDIHNYRSSLFGNANTALSGPLTGIWSPDGRQSSPFAVTDADARTALLSSFDGLDPNGDWTLFVADLSGGDLHQLNSWGLEFGPVAASVPDTGSTAGLLALGIAALVWAVRRARPSSSFRRDRWVRATQRASQLVLISVALALPGGLAAGSEGGSVTVWGDFVMYPLNGYGASFTEIAAGGDHNLTITSKGTIVAWGDNSKGQCDVPEGLRGLVAVSAGFRHSLALLGDGTVVAWGADYAGQCDVPGGLTGVIAISAGANHSMALTGDGNVVAWGGTGFGTEFGQCDVPGNLGSVVAIAAGGNHSLALRSDGTVAAWGDNDLGQCDVPSGLQGVKAIAAGGEQSLALKSDGSVVAWGAFSSQVPPGLSNVTAIAAGYLHALALIADGSVVAWGDEFFGQVYGQMDVPVSLRDVVAIAGGYRHSVALKRDGTMVSWGSPVAQTTSPTGLTDILSIAAGGGPYDVMTLVLKSDGTVMTTSAIGQSIFPLPNGLDNVVAVAAGEYYYLALRRNGAVVAWGDNSGGQCDVLPGLTGAIAIAGGVYHSLAVGPDANPVLAWGNNLEGECTVPWNAKSEIVAVAAGNGFSLALRIDGTLLSWGDNSEGQCDVPPGLTGVVSISSHYEHSLALKADGTVVAWGWNGDGQCDVPQGLSNVVAIAAGHYHSLALKDDGTVVAWGAKSRDPRLTAVPRNLSGVTAIAAGEMGSIALFGNVNHPPSPGAYQLTTSRNTSVSVGLFDLHQACSDPDWDTFIITGVSPSSAAGGIVQITSKKVTYVPPTDFVGGDSFTYTVRDSRGGIAQGTVLVTVKQAGGGGRVTIWGDFVMNPPEAYGARFTNIVGAFGRYLAITTEGKVVGWGAGGWACVAPAGLSDVVAVAAGLDHSLALRSDGTVVAWGFDYWGQCDVPAGLEAVTAIAAGYGYSLALKADGTVIAWGANWGGQRDVPRGLSGVTAIASGSSSSSSDSYAVKGDGTVVAWGSGPPLPADLKSVIALACNSGSYVALLGNGTVVAWGGDPDLIAVPAGLNGVVAVVPGVALKSDGTVVGWGPFSSVPPGVQGIKAIAAGTWGAAGLRADGTLVSWADYNYYAGAMHPQDPPADAIAVAAGQSGNSAIGRDPLAILAADGTVVPFDNWWIIPPPEDFNDVVTVATSLGHFLALRRDGTLVTWTSWLDVPPPDGLTGVVAIATGDHHSLALEEDGNVVAWENNWPVDEGQSDVPAGLSEVVAVSAGASHSLALRADGTVAAWGDNSLGQCDVPPALNHVVAIAAGSLHNLALQRDGTVVAWGENSAGQCDVPAGLSEVSAIAAGQFHSMALKADGTVVVWGGYGVFYDEFGANIYAPVPSGLSGVTAIAAGSWISMAIVGGTNHPPLAGAYQLATHRDTTASVPLFKLHRACSDPDWDTFIITDVSASSAAGGSAGISGSSIIYTPPAGFVGSDSFTYIVRDCRGATVQGTVNVTVHASSGSGPNILGVSVQPGGAATVRFAGIPGEIYSLEASTDLITWVFLSSATAGPTGLLQFIDSDAANYSTRYYRTRYAGPANP